MIGLREGMMIMLHPRELIFVLVQKPGETTTRIVVLHGPKKRDSFIFQSEKGEGDELLQAFRDDLLRVLKGFHEQLHFTHSLASKSMRADPPISVEDLLDEELINRIIEDLKTEGIADTLEYA